MKGGFDRLLYLFRLRACWHNLSDGEVRGIVSWVGPTSPVRRGPFRYDSGSQCRWNRRNIRRKEDIWEEDNRTIYSSTSNLPDIRGSRVTMETFSNPGVIVKRFKAVATDDVGAGDNWSSGRVSRFGVCSSGRQKTSIGRESLDKKNSLRNHTTS